MMTWIVRRCWLRWIILGVLVFIGETHGGSVIPPGLEKRIGDIASRAGTNVGVSILHIESGRTISAGGRRNLPLYSVVKLPLAVVVLKDVETKALRLDQKVSVQQADVAPGVPSNNERWQSVPIEVTIEQLLESSLVDSDNTACDKLLSLIGGPGALTTRIGSLGCEGISAKTSIKEMSRHPEHPNRSSAHALTQLLAALQRGNILQPAERAVLFDFMRKARTGLHRIPGALPAGTIVMHKTGTGSAGSAVNDVGIITLPDDRGHLAIAVLISASKLPATEQEKVIADIALAAYEGFLGR